MAHSPLFVSERIDDDDETKVKRAKRDQSGVTGKNIVVLRSQDVVRRGGVFFMPNTIEMACIKKPGMGQFKTNVEFSSIMSEDDVKERLERTFPLLTGQRFYCAAAADSRTRLEFHGKPRLWNGHSIKKWIKGNSALYILTEVMVDMPGTFEFTINNMNGDKGNSTEQLLRRTYPAFKRSTLTDSVKVPASQVTASIHCLCEGQVDSAMLDVQTKCTTSGMIKHFAASRMMASCSLCGSPQLINQVNTVMHSKEAGVTQHSRLRNTPMEQLASKGDMQVTPMQSCVPSRKVLATGDSSDASSGLSLEQELQEEDKNIPSNPVELTTACFGDAGCPNVSQVKTSQIRNTTAINQQSLTPVCVTKVAAQKDCIVQTSVAILSPPSKQKPQSMVAAGDRGVTVLTSMKIPQIASKELADFSGSANIKPATEICAATSRRLRKGGCCAPSNCYHGLPLSTTPMVESDSGVETADSSLFLCSVSSQATGLSDLMQDYKYKSQKNPPVVEELERVEMPILEREFGKAVGHPLLQLSVVASKIRSSVTKKPSIVRDISPRSSPVQGGSKFYIILEESLPRAVSFGRAFFGSFGRATLRPVNDYTLTGTVPPAQSPGIVTVTVNTSEAQYLGESLFEYVDEMVNLVRNLVRNRRLLIQFHHLMSHEMGKVTEAAQTNHKPKPVASKLQTSDQTESDIDYYGDAENSSKESCSSADEEDEFHPVAAQSPGIVRVTVKTSETQYVWESLNTEVSRTVQTASSNDEKDNVSDSLDDSSRHMNAAGNMGNLFSNSATSGDIGKRIANEEDEESLAENGNIKSVLSSDEDAFSSRSCASGCGQKVQQRSYNSDGGSSVVMHSVENSDFNFESKKDSRSIEQPMMYEHCSSISRNREDEQHTVDLETEPSNILISQIPECLDWTCLEGDGSEPEQSQPEFDDSQPSCTNRTSDSQCGSSHQDDGHQDDGHQDDGFV